MANKQLPLELLIKIFHNLPQQDLFECRTVCGLWKKSVDSIFWKKMIHLANNASIGSFLETVAREPSFLPLIERLTLGSRSSANQINDEQQSILFSSALQIKELTLYTSALLITLPLISQEICPLLNTLNIHGSANTSSLNTHSPFHYRSHNYTMQLNQQVVSFFSRFSNIKNVVIGADCGFLSVSSWLPLFEQAHNLKSVNLTIQRRDDKDFAEQYINTSGRQEIITTKLAKVEKLIINDPFFCKSSIEFFTRYFTGLNNLNYVNSSVSGWSDGKCNLFKNAFLDFISKSIESNIHLKGELLPNMFPLITSKMFNQIPTTYIQMKTCLKVNLSINTTPTLFMTSRQYNNTTLLRKIEYYCPMKKLRTRSMVSILTEHETEITAASITIPNAEYVKAKSYFSKVAHLDLQANGIIRDEFTFTSNITVFKSLKTLRLLYFCGVVTSSGFKIPLDVLNLEKLYLDVTPIYKHHYRRHKYLILNVEAGGRKHVYKVYFKDLHVDKVKDLEEENNNTHKRVTVSVAGVEFIKLYLYPNIIRRNTHESQEMYLDAHLDKVQETIITIN